MERPLSMLKTGLKSSFESGNYSDLKIQCQGHEWCVHKVVVCNQCDFFERACRPGFKEAEENMIDLKEDHPAAIQAMLEYFYHFEYSTPDPLSPSTELLMFQVLVYITAEKYGLHNLKSSALRRFRKIAKKCDPTNGDFVTLTTMVYDNTPASDRDLRDLICNLAIENLQSLLQEDNFKLLIIRGGEFGLELLSLASSKLQNVLRLPDKYSSFFNTSMGGGKKL